MSNLGPAAPPGPVAPFTLSVLRDVLRRWPLVLVIALAALAASALALSRRESSYTATATLVITPLAQEDETFLGTSLLREAADANRTAETAATSVDSPAVAGETARRLGARWTAPSVRDAVDVQPVDKVNALAVTAVASDPRWASRLATAFAGAVLRVRWRTIAGELDHRITDLGARLRAAPDDGDLAHQRRVIVGVRRSGRDPTLKLEGTDPAVAVGRAPAVAIVLLALLGGLFIGALAAVGLARFGRRVHNDDDVLLTYPLPVVARMRPGTAAAEDLRRLAVQVQHWAPEGGTIAVASASDGDGRTTAAAGLAAAIAEDGTAATVVELDRRPPVIEQRSEPPPVQELLAEARALADFVVVDAPPPSRDPRALRAATLADVVLLLVRLGHTARQELRKARELLEQTGVRPAGVVLVEGGDRRLMEGSHPADQASARPPAPPDAVSLRS